MAVVVKLTRRGRKNDPKYRIVVAHKGLKRDGKYIEKIGFYDPVADPYVLQVDNERLTHWLNKGAKMTEGISKLLTKRTDGK